LYFDLSEKKEGRPATVFAHLRARKCQVKRRNEKLHATRGEGEFKVTIVHLSVERGKRGGGGAGAAIGAFPSGVLPKGKMDGSMLLLTRGEGGDKDGNDPTERGKGW